MLDMFEIFETISYNFINVVDSRYDFFRMNNGSALSHQF